MLALACGATMLLGCGDDAAEELTLSGSWDGLVGGQPAFLLLVQEGDVITGRSCDTEDSGCYGISDASYSEDGVLTFTVSLDPDNFVYVESSDGGSTDTATGVSTNNGGAPIDYGSIAVELRMNDSKSALSGTYINSKTGADDAAILSRVSPTLNTTVGGDSGGGTNTDEDRTNTTEGGASSNSDTNDGSGSVRD